jgi:hypothetical protein
MTLWYFSAAGFESRVSSVEGSGIFRERRGKGEEGGAITCETKIETQNAKGEVGGIMGSRNQIEAEKQMKRR